MSETIYIDTNIYLDYLYNRIDRLRPLGDFAFNLLSKSLRCEYNIVTSDLVFAELSVHTTEKQIFELFQWLDSKIILIESTKEERRISKSKKNKNDYLHLLLAKRSNAKYLVTRNISDFPSGIISLEFPENL